MRASTKTHLRSDANSYSTRPGKVRAACGAQRWLASIVERAPTCKVCKSKHEMNEAMKWVSRNAAAINSATGPLLTPDLGVQIASFKRGRNAVLDKMEEAAKASLADVSHDSWCYTKAHGCNGCSHLDDFADALADFGRPAMRVELRRQREATR